MYDMYLSLMLDASVQVSVLCAAHEEVDVVRSSTLQASQDSVALVQVKSYQTASSSKVRSPRWVGGLSSLRVHCASSAGEYPHVGRLFKEGDAIGAAKNGSP
jgi:hypothetical protein